MKHIDCTTWTEYWFAEQKKQQERQATRELWRDAIILGGIAIFTALTIGAFWPV